MNSSIPLHQPVPTPSTNVALFLFKVFLKGLALVVFLILSVAGGLATGAYFRLSTLPDVGKLQYYNAHERSEVVTLDGKVLTQIFGEENRKVLLLKDIPKHVSGAVLAIEDARFHEHTGVDLIGILRAVKANIDSNDTVQGGSTITQQVVKNLFFTPERTLARKAAEAVLSVQVDQKFSKDQILELYLNLIYWGHNAYGIEAASETFFGKSARYLKLHEAALLAGLIRGPEAFSPYRNYSIAKTRQILVLNKMAEHGYVTVAEAEAAKKEPIKLNGIRRGMQYPYFTSYVMHVLKQKFTETELETRGFRVYTTMDTQAQIHAEKVVKERLAKLANYNIQQGALVAIEPKTGYVRAMVGGVDFTKSKFNRAYQAQRQTGSSFKPIIYLTGFENGYTPSTVEVDGPTVYRMGPRSTWSPQNYGRSYSGPTTIYSALIRSVNVVAVKVMDKVGIDKVVEMSKRLGISSPVQPYLSSALGASEVTPLEMAAAYAVFANDGVRVEPTPIAKIVDKFGNVVLDNTKPQGKRVVGQAPVRALNYALQGVVSGGTGTAARVPGHYVAGKTGTTSSHRDAWFVGYTPQLATAVWVGNDTPTRMYGATGGVFCAPIFQDFMVEALKKRPADKFPPQLRMPVARKYGKGTAIVWAEYDPAKEKAKKEEKQRQAAAAEAAKTTRMQQAFPTYVRPPSGRLTESAAVGGGRMGRMSGGESTGASAP